MASVLVKTGDVCEQFNVDEMLETINAVFTNPDNAMYLWKTNCDNAEAWTTRSELHSYKDWQNVKTCMQELADNEMQARLGSPFAVAVPDPDGGPPRTLYVVLAESTDYAFRAASNADAMLLALGKHMRGIGLYFLCKRMAKRAAKALAAGRRCACCSSVFEDSPKHCAGCIGVYYCNAECQLNDWRRHKPYCRGRGDIFFHKATAS